MEQKKSPKADMEQQRTTGFLLGLVFVLAVFYVALEWNSSTDDGLVNPVDINDMIHESELVPMSNEEVVTQLEEKKQNESAEQLNINEGDDDETLLQDLQQENDKALAALNVDPQNPLNFHIAEELPQFPGGAVELMKWLTKNLCYPPQAQERKIQGKVVTVFYVEKDGSISGIKVIQSLSPDCDKEAIVFKL